MVRNTAFSRLISLGNYFFNPSLALGINRVRGIIRVLVFERAVGYLGKIIQLIFILTISFACINLVKGACCNKMKNGGVKCIDCPKGYTCMRGWSGNYCGILHDELRRRGLPRN
ncbi:unnamed protein product [Meloidogyne enterolobii]|uniref:Uncharacterized protein n=1 Tax=Meloidogyne enterolobii TaxID=390850 RepID=A0ACB1A6H6_MELEN